MKSLEAEYNRKKEKLNTYFDTVLYKIFAQNPDAEWTIRELQDEIEADWGIRPYHANIIRHANNFYQKHHIPLFYKTSFDKDKYRLNTAVDANEWEELFKPKPRGRPRKNKDMENDI